MIRAWLKAGVVENGRLSRTEEGTPQGGVISPLLLNIALHGMEEIAGARYGADHYAKKGTPVLIRYADLCRDPHRSAYAERRVMPSGCLDRLWLLGLAAESSA
jgi:retron-type reverse transcriptase